MMRVNELFYDLEEPEFMISTSAQQVIRDPKLFIDSSVKVPDGKDAQKAKDKPEDKHKPIVMDVSICCSSCVEVLEPEIREVKGVKEVVCEICKKKVTVTGTAAVADVLSAARKHFKHAKLSS